MSDDLYSQHGSHVRLPQGGWSRGRVVLTGVASYSTSVGGVGSTGALTGPYVLAREPAKQWDASRRSVGKFNLQAAAEEYERVVRPLIHESQGLSPMALRAMSPRTELGIRVLHVFVKAVAALRINRPLATFGSPDETENLKYPDYFKSLKKEKKKEEEKNEPACR